MRTHHAALLTLATLALTLSSGSLQAADEPAAGKPKPGGLSSIADILAKTGLPNLSVSIEPEKLGPLSDNLFGLNRNKVNLLSGNRLTVQVTIHDAAEKTPKVNKASGKKAPEKKKASGKKPSGKKASEKKLPEDKKAGKKPEKKSPSKGTAK